MKICPFKDLCTEDESKCAQCMHSEVHSYFIPTEDYLKETWPYESSVSSPEYITGTWE